jgi:DNA-binding MarR family transcriptional regulator
VPDTPLPGAPPADSTTADAELASRLRLVVARLNRRVRHEANIDGEELTASSVAALATIERAGPITLGELAAEERVQPPSMTRIVARLEEQGYVTRVVDDHDRRVARAAITASGRRFLARSRTKRDAFLARQVEQLSPEERVLLAQVMPVLEHLVEGGR